MSQREPGVAWARADFLVVAVTTNLLYAIACILPDSFVLAALFLALLVVIPMNFVVGRTWAIVSARSREGAWCLVVLVAILPVVTLFTFWPLRLGFLLSKPAMERTADAAAAGQAVSGPRSVGRFTIQEIVVDAEARRVELLTVSNRSHPAGFVRLTPGAPQPGGSGTVTGSNLNIHLYGRWSYREDD